MNQKHITGLEPTITLEHVPGRPITYERHRNGTYFHAQTDHHVRELLERARGTDRRLRLFYGATEGDDIGRDWCNEYDMIGRIGRSMGPLRVPLLIAKQNDAGGPAILDHCIVRVVDVASRQELYRHMAYRSPQFEVKTESGSPDLSAAVYRLDTGKRELHARFKTTEKAHRWTAFMAGERMAA